MPDEELLCLPSDEPRLHLGPTKPECSWLLWEHKVVAAFQKKNIVNSLSALPLWLQTKMTAFHDTIVSHHFIC